MGALDRLLQLGQRRGRCGPASLCGAVAARSLCELQRVLGIGWLDWRTSRLAYYSAARTTSARPRARQSSSSTSSRLAFEVPWEVLAAVGKVECDHGRAPHRSSYERQVGSLAHPDHENGVEKPLFPSAE